MSRKKPNLKLRLFLLHMGSFVISIAPLAACFCFKWDEYTGTPGDTVKLCLGGVMVVIFMACKALGKLQVPRRIVAAGAVFVMAYLLQAVLRDLLLLSGMYLAGEFMDLIFFQGAIRRTKEDILVGKTADATTAQIEKVFQKYVDNGRV